MLSRGLWMDHWTGAVAKFWWYSFPPHARIYSTMISFVAIYLSHFLLCVCVWPLIFWFLCPDSLCVPANNMISVKTTLPQKDLYIHMRQIRLRAFFFSLSLSLPQRPIFSFPNKRRKNRWFVCFLSLLWETIFIPKKRPLSFHINHFPSPKLL